jgi:hypothetical protein
VRSLSVHDCHVRVLHPHRSSCSRQWRATACAIVQASDLLRSVGAKRLVLQLRLEARGAVG